MSIKDLVKLNLIWQFNIRLEPNSATAPAAPKIIVVKSDLKK